jgi:hypothetical protein
MTLRPVANGALPEPGGGRQVEPCVHLTGSVQSGDGLIREQFDAQDLFEPALLSGPPRCAPGVTPRSSMALSRLPYCSMVVNDGQWCSMAVRSDHPDGAEPHNGRRESKQKVTKKRHCKISGTAGHKPPDGTFLVVLNAG